MDLLLLKEADVANELTPEVVLQVGPRLTSKRLLGFLEAATGGGGLGGRVGGAPGEC